MIEYDATNVKQYQSNKSLALRMLTIFEIHGVKGKILYGRKNNISAFGKSKNFLLKVEWGKVVFISLECLGNPKLNWVEKCKTLFPEKNKCE